MEGDRNLLFALLAMQLKGLSADQVVEASATWTEEAPSPLAERLVACGALSAQDRDVLERLMQAAIEAHEGDVLRVIETFGGRERVEAAFQDRLGGSQLDVMKTMPMSSVSFLGEDGQLSFAVEERPGRYSQISQYARGGMARVLLVHDEQIGRNVALKELLPPSESHGAAPGSSPAARTASLAARFLHEARITGQLEHPAIVPVYELGRRAGGHLYYTMKLVRGRTLGEAIQQCRNLQERLALLPHFLGLCHAIAYAHSRGIIHRDIKPANVMAGEFGETVVLDWGLAKRLAGPDPHADGLREVHETIDVHGGDALPHTAYGRALGTPNYMPPEQAEGRLEDIDERSDVYSLGAVLYEMLTGEPPFRGASASEVIGKVVSEPLLPVPAFEAHVPPELAHICHKALDRDRARRYQSAGELARDIEGFLSGALVKTYDYRPAELLRHFYRKHRAMLNLAVGALALLLVIAAYAYASIARARDQEREQRLAAEQASRVAMNAQRLEEAARGLAERQAYVAQIRLARASAESGNAAAAIETLWQTPEPLRNWEWGYLLNALHQDLFTVDGHRQSVVLLAYSPGGEYIASASILDPVRVWDADTGSLVRTLEGPDRWLLALDFAPDGRRIAAGSRDGTATVWDLESGKPVHTLAGHTNELTALRFSSDGRTLITAARDGTARLWDVESGGELAVLKNGGAPITFARFSPGARFAVAEDEDGKAHVWDIRSRARLYTLSARDTQFSPDDTRLAVVDGAQCRVLEAATGEVLFTLKEGEDTLRIVAFGKTGDRLVTASVGGEVVVWDLGTREPVASLRTGLETVEAAFVLDGAAVFVFGGAVAVLMDATSGAELTRLRGHAGDITALATRPSVNRVATGSMDKTFKVWDLPSILHGAILARHRLGAKHAAYSSDGSRAVTVSIDDTARVINTRNSGVETVFAGFTGLAGGTCAAFSPDGGRLVTVLDAFTPIVWDHAQRRPAALLRGHAGRVSSAVFDPGGLRIATASRDTTVRLWDAATGKELLVIDGHAGPVHSAVFSADGARLLTAAADSTVREWDAANGAPIRSFSLGPAFVYSAEYSPDGTRIVAGASDGTARILDAVSGAEILTLKGHARGVSGASFSPDGSRVITHSRDSTTRVWTADAGEELLVMTHDAWPQRALFTPDGARAVTAGYDGLVRVWAAAPWEPGLLPGAADVAWRERFDLWRKECAAASDYHDLLHPDAPVVIVTTVPVFLTALERLAVALDGDAQGSGIRLDAGPRLDAVRRICLAEGDVLLRLDTRELSGAADLAALREALAARLAGEAPAPVEAEILRGGHRVPVTFVFVDAVETVRRIQISRAEAQSMIHLEMSALRDERETLLKVSRDHAVRMGEPIGDGPEAVNGRWLTGPATAADSAIFLRLGLAPGDRIRTVDGKEVNTLGVFQDAYAAARKKLVLGQPVESVYTVERGEFERITLTISVE